MQTLSQISADIEERKKTIEILSTGFMQLDEYLDGGFLKEEFIVLGGGTGRGKSMWGVNLFYNIASQGYKSAYFSLEISNRMLVSRIYGMLSGVTPARIMIKMLSGAEEEKRMRAEAEASIYENGMDFYDDVYKMEDIEKAMRASKYDFVVVDFLQNVMLRGMDEYERLSFISLRLQKLAKELNCCVLGISQLSNAMSKSKDSSVVEYKGSGGIGTATDLGFFIEDSNMQGVSKLRLRKNRRGLSGDEFFFHVDSGSRLSDKA